MILRSAVIWSFKPMISSKPRVRSSSSTPAAKVSFVISRLFSLVMTSERGPFKSMKSRMVFTWDLPSFSSVRDSLVCSGVTFSAWSMILLISLVFSFRFRDSRRPLRILRLEMRARTGVERSKLVKTSRRVEMTSAS